VIELGFGELLCLVLHPKNLNMQASRPRLSRIVCSCRANCRRELRQVRRNLTEMALETVSSLGKETSPPVLICTSPWGGEGCETRPIGHSCARCAWRLGMHRGPCTVRLPRMEVQSPTSSESESKSPTHWPGGGSGGAGGAGGGGDGGGEAQLTFAISSKVLAIPPDVVTCAVGQK
jgi:uncharacterized membrane protein YgcG